MTPTFTSGLIVPPDRSPGETFWTSRCLMDLRQHMKALTRGWTSWQLEQEPGSTNIFCVSMVARRRRILGRTRGY
ncbi:hypothetical protein TCAP_07150 [Tolypocladium capitatum]|uniref:Uncharacterized protein n=1 Tax=Tolypocladium capitatum TaxID=45235 RepID=A0A2K3Q4D3_9HYPO|nr:hypothetical protein TCAP_07150 [Tolypocladium capitatum]